MILMQVSKKEILHIANLANLKLKDDILSSFFVVKIQKNYLIYIYPFDLHLLNFMLKWYM